MSRFWYWAWPPNRDPSDPTVMQFVLYILILIFAVAPPFLWLLTLARQREGREATNDDEKVLEFARLYNLAKARGLLS